MWVIMKTLREWIEVKILILKIYPLVSIIMD